MAYSMNWRPQLDEIVEGSKPAVPSTSKLGPIAGLLPPSRYAPDTASKQNGTQFSNSYNMNWRPKYDDEEEEPPASKPMPASAVVASASSRAHAQNLERQLDGRTFRVSLSEECPPVQCLGSHAFACVNDGVACTLERGDGVPSIGIPAKWTLHVHPSAAKLSHRHTNQLSQAIYCCLYAALAKSGEDALRLKLVDPEALGPSAQKAIINLGIPLDLSLPIAPSFLLQLYQHAEPHLLTPAFPFFAIQSFNGSRQPVAHPARPPPSQSSPQLVYSRYDSVSKNHCRLYVQTAARGSEWITISPWEPNVRDLSLQIQLSWALEDPALEVIASEVNDYDRGKTLHTTAHTHLAQLTGVEHAFVVIHLEGQSDPSWKGLEPHLKSLCHYALLTEVRCTRLWVRCTSEEDTRILSEHGWKSTESNTKPKGQVDLIYITQKDFWNNIKSL